MKQHVWRPLYVVVGIVAAILLLRLILVPEDFGIHERGYMYGYHRLGNEQEWKDFSAKYQPPGYCDGCHDARSQEIDASAHRMIPCENCHGAALAHPEDPEKLPVDRNRDLCLRCHARLFTPSSLRGAIPGIDPERHNSGMECSSCHNPHNPALEEM